MNNSLISHLIPQVPQGTRPQNALPHRSRRVPGTKKHPPAHPQSPLSVSFGELNARSVTYGPTR
jgi:hypothetical protein